MFESILSASSTNSSISISSSVLSLAAAVVIGLVIGFAYSYSSKKKSYNKEFIVGLSLLPAIVSIVILLIGSNIASAFSMAGAFALVRFRSAPGSAKDIAIVFFAMASGLACGLGFITYACISVVVILGLLLVLSLSGYCESRSVVKQLKVTIPENLNYQSVFDEVFAKYAEKSELRNVKTTNMGTLFELTYHVGMKKESDEKSFIDELRCRNGNLNISLGIVPDQNQSMLN